MPRKGNRKNLKFSLYFYAPLVLAPAEGGHFPRFAWENYAPLIRGWGLTDGLKLKLEWGLTNGIKFSEKMFLRV